VLVKWFGASLYADTATDYDTLEAAENAARVWVDASVLDDVTAVLASRVAPARDEAKGCNYHKVFVDGCVHCEAKAKKRAERAARDEAAIARVRDLCVEARRQNGRQSRVGTFASLVLDALVPARFAPAPNEPVERPRVYRGEVEGVGRMVGVHEPECVGLNRDDDLAGFCDCRTIRMLIIEVLRARVFDETARADALAAQVGAGRDEATGSSDDESR
jgi:hypothetical protein